MSNAIPPPGLTSSEPAPVAPRAEYEFGEAHNVVFRQTAWNLRYGGWGVIALVVLYHIVLLTGWALTGRPPYERFRVSYIFWPLVVVCLGASFVRAGLAFGRVAGTRGSDITHLMDGLKELNVAFGFLPITWVMVFALVVAVVVVAVVQVVGH